MLLARKSMLRYIIHDSFLAEIFAFGDFEIEIPTLEVGGGRLGFGIWKNFAQGETRRHALASVPRLCTPYKVFLHINL